MKSFTNHTTSRRLFWVSVVVILLAVTVAACKPQPTDTPTPLPSVPPTEQLVEPTTTMRVEQADPLLDINPVPIQQVWGIEWRWTAWVETQPASQSIVPDSKNYHLVLNNDGTYLVKADCNMVSGSYQTDDINLTLNPGPMTLAQCDPESLSDQYLDLLAKVMSFGMRDGDLVLILQNNAGSMSFSNAGSYQPVPPSIPCVVGIDVSTVTVETLGLPYSYKANCVPETPYDASLPTGPIGLPDHVEINFGVGDFQDVSPTDPIIYIIPVSKYQDLWIQAGDDAVSNSISMLEGLLDIKLAPVPSKGLPILPFERVTGVADMQVQGAYLDVTMGAGMRFVTRFVQTPNPVASDVPQMFYTFQGFSSDGAYLIAFFYPVTTEELSKANAITQEEQDFVSANSQAYMDAKITELNALEPSDWEPDLKQLDAVINTLKWGLGTGTPDITGVNWQWTSLAESNPASQSVVPDPPSPAKGIVKLPESDTIVT